MYYMYYICITCITYVYCINSIIKSTNSLQYYADLSVADSRDARQSQSRDEHDGRDVGGKAQPGGAGRIQSVLQGHLQRRGCIRQQKSGRLGPNRFAEVTDFISRRRGKRVVGCTNAISHNSNNDKNLLKQ